MGDGGGMGEGWGRDGGDEKSALIRVSEHIDNNDLHCKFQSAYKTGHSTEAALLRIKSDIMQAMDNGQAVFMVLLDLSTAFDTSILLHRLSNVFGLKNYVIDWFKSYLCSRTCRVKIARDFSDPKVLNYGLPQGSCVGPQLFSYYTHPITDVIKRYSDVKYHFYADDTQLYICVDPRKPGETDHAISILSNCISEIKNWMSNNMLLLNDDKTEFFVAANPRLMNILSDISITIGNTVIRPSLSVRNIGVTFDSAMTMSNHISSICKTLNFHLRNLSHFRIFIDKTTCYHAIRALVTSRLVYAIEKGPQLTS